MSLNMGANVDQNNRKTLPRRKGSWEKSAPLAVSWFLRALGIVYKNCAVPILNLQIAGSFREDCARNIQKHGRAY
jgi:hypothetical protein